MHKHERVLHAPLDRVLHVWFEPWAEGLAFPAGTEVSLRATSTIEGKLELDETEERTAVYAWAGSTLRVVVADQVVLSFDQPVPEFLTREKLTLLFGAPPSPTEAEGGIPKNSS
jgi:hypothetical protein